VRSDHGTFLRGQEWQHQSSGGTAGQRVAQRTWIHGDDDVADQNRGERWVRSLGILERSFTSIRSATVANDTGTQLARRVSKPQPVRATADGFFRGK
jgi:hypothetical protein